MTFSEKVKATRAQLMVSQSELAKMIGVSRITITRWESQGYKPQFLTEQKFKTFCDSKGIKFNNESKE